MAMHERYRHLSYVDRVKIMFLRMSNLNVSEIARKLDRDKGTISRELGRNVSPGEKRDTGAVEKGPLRVSLARPEE